ncbi:MAG: peptidoglycan-binding protein [Mesorhizobium sp.]|nr:peptidoglycan-binding protein [Mesorhizobium sp.]MCO5159935.1 peptidoglycan-binding protein [Mesorhizobium sp.]
MRRSESRLEEDSPVAAFLRDGVVAAGAAISRNPVLVGGMTAFLVTLFYVSANALWYQPQPHASAFFITRDMPDYAAPEPPGNTFQEDEEHSAVTRPAADPTVQQVQGMLNDLNLYTGSVDGIAGPQTKKAIADYQKLVGLDPSGEIDQSLLDELMARRAPQPEGEVLPPPPAPRPSRDDSASAASLPREDILKIQAGLKAFGHDGIDIDGVVGLKTQTAIREFQSLFGLPVTGAPDERLIAKMREIGLTN